MKKYIFIFGILFLLVSCSNPSDTAKIKVLENQLQNNSLNVKTYIFDKNVECAELRDKYEDKFIAEYSWETDNVYNQQASITSSLFDVKNNKCLVKTTTIQRMDGEVTISFGLFDIVAFDYVYTSENTYHVDAEIVERTK